MSPPARRARASPVDRPRSCPGPPQPPDATRFRRAVLTWFDARARDIPFRRSRDPYAVLVAEVMAQQTQIARVEPAWARFLDRFPSISALAAAAPGDVVRAWSGLGYNRRAIALHRTAGAVGREHDGRLPANVAALEALPGVGPYTARAVAATAFGLPVAAVDTNVRRVLTRVVGAELPPRALQHVADTLLDRRRPADWTHAVMDIGAAVCRARNPACTACPLASMCVTHKQHGARGSVRPARSAARSTTRFEQTYRWLRGRIVARLVDVPNGQWLTIRGAVGSHDADSVDRALAALVADGVIERDRRGRVRLPTRT